MNKLRKKFPSKLPPSTLPTPKLTPEEERELDFDICCCIEEIDNILLSNPTEKQKKMAEVSLKILKNPSEIHIKKKQVMRQWFGDYKSKFEVKKKQVMNGLNESKISFKKPKAHIDSVCFRKHLSKNNDLVCSSTGAKNELNCDSNSSKACDNSFKFAFET